MQNIDIRGLYLEQRTTSLIQIVRYSGKYDGDSDGEIIIHMIVNIFIDKIAC